VVVSLALLGVAAATIGALLLASGGDGDDGHRLAAQRFLAAWSTGDVDGMQGLVTDPGIDVAAELEAVAGGLRATGQQYELVSIEDDDGAMTASFAAEIEVGGVGLWTYDGSMPLIETDDGWRVEWSPAVVHPLLRVGDALRRWVEWPARAPILGADGLPLVDARPSIIIGIEPRRMADRAEVESTLAAELEVHPETVAAALEAPGVQPDHFVPIVEVPREVYDQHRDVVHPVPGLVFRESTLRGTGRPGGMAHHLLGFTGEITAEQLEELGEPYQAGDLVGLGGLEERFERELAGRPSGEIRVVGTEGETLAVLHRVEGTDPEPLRTTLDGRVQQAAEQALESVDRPAALVVVDASGQVRAVVSRPLGEGFNRAIAGRYPPGSTFKVVTADALLTAGLAPGDPVECPPEAVVGGRRFRNFEGEAAGLISFADAFAASCNTAFIGAATRLARDDLQAAAERFGFNAGYTLGLTTSGGSFPPPENEVETAAATLGQGRVTASPLHMATVAAAVMSGNWTPPVVLPDPGPPPAAGSVTPNRADLDAFMRGVVSRGSGTAAQVPGRTLAGKTGTAEYGEGDPPPTHAWFIGYGDGLALAVLVEDGGVGGRVAAPLAARFFSLLG
jgi:cell division protein FtsI/penicillin-binding protein 2